MNFFKNRLVLLFLFTSIIIYFYKYPKLIVFDADQEFYAKQYVEIVKLGKPTLVGIQTSFGGLFVGPLYSYLIAFVYWMFQGYPLGMSLLTLLFSSFQASLTYYLFGKLKGQKVGIFTGVLCLFSSALWSKGFVVNAINFFYPLGLLFFYLLIKFKGNQYYFLWLTLVLGLTLQIHLILLIFFPILAVVLIKEKFWQKFKTTDYLTLFTIILISLLPLILFDLRHEFLITQNLTKFINQGKNIQVNYLENITRIPAGIINTLWHSIFPFSNFITKILLTIGLIFFIFRSMKQYSYKIITIIFGITLLGGFFYRGPLPDYFFFYLLAPFFFIVGDVLATFSKINFYRPVIIGAIILFIFQNFNAMSQSLNPYNLFIKERAVKYLKSQTRDRPVKVYLNTDLGLQYGFDYLMEFYQIERIDSATETYEIELRGKNKEYGILFKEPEAKVGINVIKLTD